MSNFMNSIRSSAILALALLASGGVFANGTHTEGHGQVADDDVGRPGVAAKATRTVNDELVLGSEKELKAHYDMMMKHPGMQHADPNVVTLAPGKSGEIVWQFTKAGKIDFACLQPGHYDAGMKGAVNVTKGPAK